MKLKIIINLLFFNFVSCCLVPHHKEITKIGDYRIDINSNVEMDLQVLSNLFPIGLNEKEIKSVCESKLNKKVEHITWVPREPYIIKLTRYSPDCVSSESKKLYIYCENGVISDIDLRESATSL